MPSPLESSPQPFPCATPTPLILNGLPQAISVPQLPPGLQRDPPQGPSTLLHKHVPGQHPSTPLLPPPAGAVPASQHPALPGLPPWTHFHPTARHTRAISHRVHPPSRQWSSHRRALEPKSLRTPCRKGQQAKWYPQHRLQWPSLRTPGDPGWPHCLLRGATMPPHLTEPWHCPHYRQCSQAPPWNRAGPDFLSPQGRAWPRAQRLAQVGHMFPFTSH